MPLEPPPGGSVPRQRGAGLGRHGQLVSGVLLLLALLLLAGRGLLNRYSFWSDELWSVAASSSSWNDLFFRWLLPDTHPPLYQSLLKIWINLFGSSEPATRCLSFLLAAIALLATAFLAAGRGAGRQIITLSILGTSPLFIFYAQETRSYSLSLMLSSLMLGSLLVLRQSAVGADRLVLSKFRTQVLRCCFYGSTLLLGLTHYFSMLFALVVLAVATAEGVAIVRWRSALPLLVAMLSWPTIHFLYLFRHGGVEQTLRRVEWLEVQPVVGTLSQISKGLIPALYHLPDAPLGTFVAALLAITLLACLTMPVRAQLRQWWQTPANAMPWHQGELRFLLVVLGLFLGLLLIIDPLRPVSRFRYHIVVVPLLAFLGGDLWSLGRHQRRWYPLLIAAFYCTFIGIEVATSDTYMKIKQGPLMDYRKVASFISNSDVCREGCWSLGWPVPALEGSYFRGMKLRDLPAEAVTSPNPLNLPLLVFHEGVKDVPLIRSSHPELQCWEAPGSLLGSFVFLPADRRDNAPSRFGLRRCSPLPP